jgi:protein tyrosine phosphatase
MRNLAQEFATCCAERRKQPIIYKIEYSEAVAAAGQAAQQPQLAARLAANVARNRNQDVVPYDAHRVKLRSDGEGDESDYINASFCSGLLPGTSYIVTQGKEGVPSSSHKEGKG